MLASCAGPIICATCLAGGKVSVVGAVLGLILLALIADGLIFLKIDIYFIMIRFKTRATRSILKFIQKCCRVLII